MVRSRRPLRLVAVASLAALLLASCRADVRLDVRVDEDGSGVVRVRFVLDEEAVEALGGDLERRVRAADLVRAGWDVAVTPGSGGSEGPDSRAPDDTGPPDDTGGSGGAGPAGSGAAVVAEKAFSNPEELAAVVRELSGDVGPFRDFDLERARSRFRTSFAFEGVVDLREGVAATALDPGDEGLVAELADEGIPVERLRRFLAEQIDDVFRFEVGLHLPGTGSHNARGEVGGVAVWEPQVGERTELRASSSSLDVGRVAAIALAALLAVLALGAWFGLHRRLGSSDDTG